MKHVTEEERAALEASVADWIDQSPVFFDEGRSALRNTIMEYVANLNGRTCFAPFADQTTEEQPYVSELLIPTSAEADQYNPNYGDDRVCECGHVYYRHFDSYENMFACGCKYCECYRFTEKVDD